MNKNIMLIRFSSRNEGNCAKVASYIGSYFKASNVSEYVVDSNNVTPCGKCNCECLKDGQLCPNRTNYMTELIDTICSSDMVYFIVPNHCGFPCANYFAFNERTVGYFSGKEKLLEKYLAVRKRFIVISNSEEGFRQAMQQQVSCEPEILYLKSRNYGKSSVAGDLLDSADARADLEAFLE